MPVYMYVLWMDSQCSTPAFLQLLAIYIFGAAAIADFTSLDMLQVCLWCRQIEHDEDGRILAIRPTSSQGRLLLSIVPLTDLFVESATFIIGCIFLMRSSSVLDVVMNALALSFITQMDEITLNAFVSKASRSRLSKYKFERVLAIEDGVTTLNQAGRVCRCYTKFQ